MRLLEAGALFRKMMQSKACMAAGALSLLACAVVLSLAIATPSGNEASAPLLLRSTTGGAVAGRTVCVHRRGLVGEARAAGAALPIQRRLTHVGAKTKLRQRREEDEAPEEEEEEYCDTCAEQVLASSLAPLLRDSNLFDL